MADQSNDKQDINDSETNLSSSEASLGSKEPPSLTIDLTNKDNSTEVAEPVKASQNVPEESTMQDLRSIDTSPSIKKTSKSVLEPANVGSGEEITRRGKKKVYLVGVIVTVLILGAVGTVFFFRIKESTQNLADKSVAVNTQAEKGSDSESTPEKSEDDETSGAGLVVTQNNQLERSEISLEILNGTDTTGLAGDTADTFKDLGYEISKIGNADDTVGNKLNINPDFEGKLGVLIGDVKQELGISSSSGDLTDSDASARIILGE